VSWHENQTLLLKPDILLYAGYNQGGYTRIEAS
jgi:hypothetical protein